MAFMSAKRAPSSRGTRFNDAQRSDSMMAFIARQRRQGKKPNRLIREKSPYLLQHAFNPVDWYPWGQEAFQRARKENKPIFLSIGYSTCYWCHVMEREVFEDEEIAALMNEYFVNIKVDREERPDVDRVYMTALLALTGSGGWPMSMFLTPDLKPFYGATYIPPERFRSLIERIHQLWITEPEKILTSSERLTEFLKQRAVVSGRHVALNETILTKGFEAFHEQYDEQYGGFGVKPKFPRPATFYFLLRYSHRFNEPRALHMTLSTLRRMAQSGIYDHLGGGFHRYAVDRAWRVPHFEKMLYDQAQLVCAYLEAYQITHDEFYASVARDILRYVRQHLTSENGGFYSAEDAESALDPSHPEEKREGAFYVWTHDEIERLLGKERAAIFNYYYGVQPDGNVPEDPHGAFVGKNILYVAHTVEDVAKRFHKSKQEIEKLLAEARTRLLAARQQRPRPHLDDKILVSWNGLMISALARAYQVLGEPAYLQAAKKATTFILTTLYDSKTGRLLRRYRAGEARFDAHLEDYAFLVMALLDLYEADLDIRWLEQAVQLTERQIRLFSDRKEGGFFDTVPSDTLLVRTKEDYDGAEPSGNSIAALNLLRLSEMLNHQQWRRMAETTLMLFSERLEQHPPSLPQMLVALDFYLDKPKQIIIAGKPEGADTRRLLRVMYERYLPNKVLLLADGGAGQEYLSQRIPFLKQVKMIDGKATAYICQNYACQLPTTDPQMVAKLLEGEKRSSRQTQ